MSLPVEVPETSIHIRVSNEYMANTTFIIPGEDRYFEDFVPNTVHEFGPIECASESSMMRFLSDYYLPEAGKLSSPEIEEFHRIRPVCSGDKLIIRVTVTESLRSTSEPYRGIVHSFVEVQNQNCEIVMSTKMKKILFCSPK